MVVQVGTTGVDPSRLERMLCERVDGEVRFDDGTRGAYSTDASNNRQVPIGVVLPRSPEAAVAAACECGASTCCRSGYWSCLVIPVSTAPPMRFPPSCMPSVRAADDDTVVLADGFSCRTQIPQLNGGGKQALHLAELRAAPRVSATGQA